MSRRMKITVTPPITEVGFNSARSKLGSLNSDFKHLGDKFIVEGFFAYVIDRGIHKDEIDLGDLVDFLEGYLVRFYDY